MWDDFSDYELVELAGSYGLEDSVVFANDLSLANRAEVEKLLTLAEYDLAFPIEILDNNSEVEYN
jgi:hypothetical protein